MNSANILLENVRSSVIRKQNRNSRRRAIHSALIAVTRTHPDYAGVGFDTKFMTNEAAVLMEPFLNGGRVPTANALVAAWAERFSHFNENVASTAAANITPLVNDFVYVLASEAATIAVVEEMAINQTITSQTITSQTITRTNGGYLSDPEYGIA